jgi:hypothetical protein
MLPYEAKLSVADRATLGRAVTKMLGVVEHLCLLSALPWSCPLPARTCRGVSRCRRSASPIDGDIRRTKRPPQSYAGKRSLSKRDREIYTEVYDAFCRRLRRSARDAKRLRAHSGQPWTHVRPKGCAMPLAVEASSAENQEKSASLPRRPAAGKRQVPLWSGLGSTWRHFN